MFDVGEGTQVQVRWSVFVCVVVFVVAIFCCSGGQACGEPCDGKGVPPRSKCRSNVRGFSAALGVSLSSH